MCSLHQSTPPLSFHFEAKPHIIDVNFYKFWTSTIFAEMILLLLHVSLIFFGIHIPQILIFNLLVVQIIVLFYLRMDCWLCLWWRLWRRSYILIILNPDNKVMALENPLAYLRLPFLAWRSPREPQTIFPLKETMINKQTVQL